MTFRSRKNFPVKFFGAFVASQTIVSAPCPTVRGEKDVKLFFSLLSRHCETDTAIGAGNQGCL
jgi:hypothetical protein